MLRGSGRSAEEIDEILTAAKLERKDLLPVSQVRKPHNLSYDKVD